MSDLYYNWGPPFPVEMRLPWERIARAECGSLQSKCRGNSSGLFGESERAFTRILKCLDGELAILRWESDDVDCLSSLLLMGSRGEINADQHFKVKLLASLCELGALASDEGVRQELTSTTVPSAFDAASVAAIRRWDG